MSQPYDEALAAVVDWGRVAFPESTLRTVLTHLERECQEWQASPDSPEEMADVLMMIAHMYDHLSRLEKNVQLLAHLYHVDLAAEIRRKLEINMQRTWGPPDAEGVIEHVRDGAQDPMA